MSTWFQQSVDSEKWYNMYDHVVHRNTLANFGAERPDGSTKRAHQVPRFRELVDFLVQDRDEEASKFSASWFDVFTRPQRLIVPNWNIIGRTLRELYRFVRTLGSIRTLGSG